MIYKYERKLVLDYINGNDIVGYNIDSLENDYMFMIQVIDYTNDKKMYNFCSDEVKNNYDLVKYLINKFNDDISFLKMITINFIKCHQDNYLNEDCVELSMLMSDKLTDKNDLESSFIVRMPSNLFFGNLSVEIETLLIEDRKNGYKNIGLGFSYIEQSYSDRPVIVYYGARELIRGLFYGNEKLRFDELIHLFTKNKNSIIQCGEKQYLLKLVEKYDKPLANYTKKHIDILTDTINDLKKVIDNWDYYMNHINIQRIDLVFSKITSYYEKESKLPHFNEIELIKYLVEKNGLRNVFIMDESYRRFIDKKDFNETKKYFNEENMNLLDRKFIKYGEELINNLFKYDIVIEKDEYIEKIIKPNKSKIIKFQRK